MDHDTNASGFHLIELVTGVALCALLAIISIPRLGELSQSALLKAEARRVGLLLQQQSARAQAGAERIMVDISPNALRFSGNNFERSLSIHESLQLESTPAGKSLTFHPSGAATPRTLTIRHKRRSCRVVVSLRGRTRWSCP